MNWKKLGNRLLFPPVWLLVILTVICTVLLTTVFVKGWNQTPVACFVYVLSFYTLSVVTVYCVIKLPKQFRQIRQKVYDSPLGNRYMTDSAFRTRSTMHLSLYINLLYMFIQLLSWHQNRSWWFVVLAGYYGILAFLWALLAGYVRSNPVGSNVPREWKRARICACILLLINLSLSGAVLMILYRSKGYNYPGIMIYVMAMYTFYSTIHAVTDMIKYRKLESPILSASKIVSLSAALVSVLNLETAMFAQFGAEMAAEDQRIFIILTGAGVSIAIVTLSVWTVCRATNALRQKM